MSPAQERWPVRGFWGLVSAHFLGAFNDNALRWFLIALTMKEVAEESRGVIVALASVLFLAPYVVCSVHAGLLADRFAKRRVLIASKAAEGLIMVACAVALFLSDDVTLDLVVLLTSLLFLGVQAAYYSPAKYGVIPEMLPERDLSWGNGIFEMTGVFAIILGTACGSGFLAFVDRERDLVSVSAALGIIGGQFGSPTGSVVAAVGVSSGMTALPTAGDLRFVAPAVFALASLLGLMGTILVPTYPAALGEGTPRPPAIPLFVERCRRFVRSKVVFTTILAVITMWSLGLLLQLNLALYAQETLGIPEHKTGIVMGVVAFGVAMGNILAGYISGKTIEFGLVPIGAIGAAIATMALYATGDSIGMTCACIVVLGVFSGMFIVPLHANLQEESEAEDKGGIWGTTNCVQTLGMLAAAGLFLFLESPKMLDLSPPQVFLVCGAGTLALAVLLIVSLPEALGRMVVWLFFRPRARVDIEGQRNVPPRGAVLFLIGGRPRTDALILLAGTRRFVQLVLPDPVGSGPVIWMVARTLGTIRHRWPLGETEEHAVVKGIRSTVARGGAVGLFSGDAADPEAPSLPLSAILRVVNTTGAAVVPVRIDRLSGRQFRLLFEPPWRREIPSEQLVCRLGGPSGVAAGERGAAQAGGL